MARDNSIKSTTKKQTWRRRILKFVLWSILFVCVLFFIFIAGLLLYLTPSRIESMAEKIVGDNLQQELDFTNAHFNIFNGFVFQDLVLSPPHDSLAIKVMPIHSASAKEISLRYSLTKIFKRQLLITSAIVDSPQVHIILTPIVADSASAEESVAAKKQMPDSLAAPHSFISLNLEKFRLKNASITVDALDSLQQQHLYLSDISIALDDVAVPRGDIVAQDSLLRGRFALECRESDCVFEQHTPELDFNVACVLDAELAVTLNGLPSINMAGSVKIENIYASVDEILTVTPREFSYPVLVEFKGNVDALAGAARLDPLSLKIDAVPWMSLYIRADSLFSTPYVQATVDESRIPIRQLLAMALPFVPDSLKPTIYLHNSDAFFSLDGSSVSGSLPDSSNGQWLTCLAKIALGNFGVTLNRNEHLLKNLNFASEVSAKLGYKTLSHPEVKIFVDYDSVFVTLPDSQKVYSGESAFKAYSALNANFTPRELTSELSIANLLGAKIRADVSLGTRHGFEQLSGQGSFSLQHFDLAPFTQSQLLSTISADAKFTLDSFKDIAATVNVETDSIIIQQESERMTLAPLHLTSTFRGATDTLFQQVTVRSLTATINDFITSELTGKAVLAPNPQVDLNHLFVSLNHPALLKWLPAQIMEPVGELRVTGKTTLNSQAHVSLSAVDTTYNASIQLETRDFNIDYQNGLASVADIVVDVNGTINSSNSAGVTLALNIAGIQSNEFTQTVFRDNKILLKLSMPDFKTVQIDTGLLDLPDLKTTGVIGGDVRLVNNIPIINSFVRLSQNAADTIRLMPDMFYQGHNEMTIDVRSDSSVATLSAQITTKDLTVSLPNAVRVDRINSHVVVLQHIDLKNGVLLISPETVVHTPSDGLIDYRLHRDYYFQSERRPSYIEIRRAIVGDYLVENIHADAYIGAGTVEIPAFALDAYGGTIGGSFSFISDKNNILESSYKMSAHMAGINSSMILPSQSSRSQGLITAHAEFRGKGFDVIQGIDLDGYFNITKIESKVADNLLSSLDPEGKDSAIKFTRLVMNYGYKPSLLTFEIGHGYCYPAVHFSQPWYNPIRLSGGRIEFARIPLASLLNMQK